MPKKIRIWANAKEKTLTENPSRSNALAPCIASEGMFEFLYENEFPDGFAMRARDRGFAWEDIIPALRNGRFFFFDNDYFAGPGANITGRPYLSQEDAVQLGGVLLHHLAALAATLSNGEAAVRSLELDGFRVNPARLELVPFEAVVSEQRTA